jgi:phenylpropionate dioxygenase-like ring-hydroxylating dioxygenase large terminal subunit
MNEHVATRQPIQMLAQTMRFPVHQWYVAAGSAEVSSNLLGRKLLGKHLVLFRTGEGEVAALSDWCPHRGFRFSSSKMIGDTIQCGYHGMRFNKTGACVEVPSQLNVPSKMEVQRYPVIERSPFVWIWLGDPARADPNLLPPELEFDDPSYYDAYTGTLNIGCNAAVAMENVIDITHASLLHPGAVDGEEWELMKISDEIEILSPTVIQTTKRFGEMVVRGFLAECMGMKDGQLVNRVRVARQYLPGLHTSTDTFYDPSYPGKILSRGIRYVGITPQDDGSCLEFAATRCTYAIGDETRIAGLAILQQDVIALEATQDYFEQSGDDFKEFSVNADRMALRARRIIAGLSAKEGAD